MVLIVLYLFGALTLASVLVLHLIVQVNQFGFFSLDFFAAIMQCCTLSLTYSVFCPKRIEKKIHKKIIEFRYPFVMEREFDSYYTEIAEIESWIEELGFRKNDLRFEQFHCPWFYNMMKIRCKKEEQLTLLTMRWS